MGPSQVCGTVPVCGPNAGVSLQLVQTGNTRVPVSPCCTLVVSATSLLLLLVLIEERWVDPLSHEFQSLSWILWSISMEVSESLRFFPSLRASAHFVSGTIRVSSFSPFGAIALLYLRFCFCDFVFENSFSLLCFLRCAGSIFVYLSLAILSQVRRAFFVLLSRSATYSVKWRKDGASSGPRCGLLTLPTVRPFANGEEYTDGQRLARALRSQKDRVLAEIL